MSEQQVAVGFVVIRSRSFGQKRNESVFRVKPIYSFEKFAETLDLNSVTESVEGVFPNYLHPAFKHDLEQAMTVFAQAEARARAAKEAARKAEQERLIAEGAQQEQQARIHALLSAEDKPQPLSKLPEGAFVMRHRGGAIASVRDNRLPFLGVFVQEGTKFYAFENTDNLDRCERCTAPLKSAGGGMYTTTLVCSGCGERVHRAKEVAVPHSHVRGAFLHQV